MTCAGVDEHFEEWVRNLGNMARIGRQLRKMAKGDLDVDRLVSKLLLVIKQGRYRVRDARLLLRIVLKNCQYTHCVIDQLSMRLRVPSEYLLF